VLCSAHGRARVLDKAARGAERELDAATKARAASITRNGARILYRRHGRHDLRRSGTTPGYDLRPGRGRDPSQGSPSDGVATGPIHCLILASGRRRRASLHQCLRTANTSKSSWPKPSTSLRRRRSLATSARLRPRSGSRWKDYSGWTSRRRKSRSALTTRAAVLLPHDALNSGMRVSVPKMERLRGANNVAEPASS
jgi:hypothetical protein